MKITNLLARYRAHASAALFAGICVFVITSDRFESRARERNPNGSLKHGILSNAEAPSHLTIWRAARVVFVTEDVASLNLAAGR